MVSNVNKQNRTEQKKKLKLNSGHTQVAYEIIHYNANVKSKMTYITGKGFENFFLTYLGEEKGVGSTEFTK